MSFKLSAGVYDREIGLSGVIPAVATSIGGIVGESNRGPLGLTTVTNTKRHTDLYGEPVITQQFHYASLAFLAKSKVLKCKRVINGALYGGITSTPSDATSTPGSVALVVGEADPTTHSFISSEAFLTYPENPGVWNNSLKQKIEIYDASQYQFRVIIYETIDGVDVEVENEIVSRLSTAKDGHGKSMYVVDRFRFSDFVRIVDNTNIAYTVMPNADSAAVSFAGGTNGTATTPALINTGWQAFANANTVDVNILINGGYTDVTTHVAMNTIAAARKDCIAVLDMPSASKAAAAAVTYRDTTLALNSTYSALYTSWLYWYDNFNDKWLYVAPSGYVAAQYAFTDSESSVWMPPAGLNRGLLDIYGTEEEYDEGMMDTMYPKQINPIIKHRAGPYVIWGQRTLSTQAQARDRVNVRRLLMTLEKSITIMLDYYVFELNIANVRSQIVTTIDDYLADIKAQGGLVDYAVVCDETNNTSVRIDNNELWVDIYIKPPKAAEFIRLQTIITKSGASFDELIAASAG